MTVSAIVAAVSALISASCAFLTYRLARKTKQEEVGEERLYAGRPVHPDLKEHDHSQAVVYFAVFNRSSKKRAFVTNVRVFNGGGREIDVTWSNQIDHLGNPQQPSGLVAVPEMCHIYARRDDGQWLTSGQIKVFHSHPNSPLVLTIDSWQT